MASGDCCALVLPVGDAPAFELAPEPLLPAAVDPPEESPSELPVRVEPEAPALDMPLPGMLEGWLLLGPAAVLCDEPSLGLRSREGPDDAAAPDESVEPPVLPMMAPDPAADERPDEELPDGPEPPYAAFASDPVEAPPGPPAPREVVAPYPLLVPPPLLVGFEEPVTPVAPDPALALPY